MDLKEKARQDHIPIIQDDGLAFLLSFLAEHLEIQSILEIGTAIGYSAIQMANVRFDMCVDTLEIDPKRYKQALENIQNAQLEDRIHVYLEDAANFKSHQDYDFIFVDAAKAQYARYVEHFIRNSHIGTYFMFDNLEFHGLVEDDSKTKNRGTKQLVHKIQKFQERLKKDSRFHTDFYLEIGDGLAVSKRIR
ncbi:O-methyltransferase [Bulleidia extructa W1219]|jgi:Predicted O-methyltransferase|uniref:O-methyltransferase n=1 Tax=Bulleidia extructa W1219 TaxID=679192 RepID=D2MML1_9FIRM|nr:class I SAM-dependent methyltransferase [Bulleidia extructa]EFC06287.1 O-methyltransferase [Bulleidia extructa W1219]